MGWGISENAKPKEKLKAEMADYLKGLNSTAKIDYDMYNNLYDFFNGLLEQMYDVGKADGAEEEAELNLLMGTGLPKGKIIELTSNKEEDE